MRKLISNTALVAIATGGMLFASCSDHDMFNPNYKAEEYAANWENKIGAVDPNQDWSMATSVTASINVAAAGNGVLNIYTENPVHSTARMLAKVFLNNGSGNATFDAVKGAEQVFVIAQNNGKNVVYGWADIVNGQVNAGKTVAKKAAKTRAGNCPVTIGETIEFAYQASTDWSHRTHKVTLLEGVEENSVQQPWTVAWGWELFGKDDAFFKENTKYYYQDKRNIEGYDINKVEQGFSITTSGGEIAIPFIFGATQNFAQLGYIYYKGEKSIEEIIQLPNYILIKDAKPDKNIYFNSWKGTALGNDMQLSNWNKNDKTYYGTPPETEVWGTEYKLAFFGENYDQPSTYKFPEGYHIVFFIAPLNSGTKAYEGGRLAYSIPEYNRVYGHKDWNTDCPTYKEGRGAVKSTAWSYNGMTFLGFEDGSDDDLNDIVFWVEGDFNTDQEIPEVPSTTQPKEESQSWILACEDLGSTDDYDFNDIVLEVRTKIETEETFEGQAKTGETFKKATLQVRCLAAGGTYQANISYDNGRVSVGESHALLGRPGSSDMLNTKTLDCPFSEWITLEETTDATEWVNIQNNNSWSIDNIAGKIQIVVTDDDNKTGNAALISAPTQGEAPQMIIVPGDWLWPTERAHIEEAYPDFKTWNSNASLTDWNANKVADKVIAR